MFNNLLVVFLTIILLWCLLTIHPSSPTDSLTNYENFQQQHPLLSTKSKSDSFPSASIPWGYQDPSPSGWNISNPSHRQIVGPDPHHSTVPITELGTDANQLHPQNTQLTHQYFRDNNDLSAYQIGQPTLTVDSSAVNQQTQQLAPITRGEVGIVTRPTCQIASVPEYPTTRVPDQNSTPQNYHIPQPSTSPLFQGPSINYYWD